MVVGSPRTIYRVYSSASQNSIPSRNFQLGISAPFSSWNFRLKIFELKFRAEIFWVKIFSSGNELKFRAEIFLSRNFLLGKGAKISSWNFRVENYESKISITSTKGAYIKYASRPWGRGLPKCVQISAWGRGEGHCLSCARIKGPEKVFHSS